MKPTIEKAREIAAGFALSGDVLDILPHRAGHINDTFIVTTQGDGACRYTLQRINGSVFVRPDLVMHNIKVVTETISRRNRETGTDTGCGGLVLVATKENRHYLVDASGDYWRCYHYVEGTTHNQVGCDLAGTMIVREAARAFADFQNHLAGVDIREIHITIENFHHTPTRFRRFCEVAALDVCGRTREARREIAFATAREPLCALISGPILRGEIPVRVTHNDTKINNVVFGEGRDARPRALCVIDLDTVMPGSALFDFGDLVRSSVCTRPEDETDVDTIEVNLDLFESLVSGYLEGSRELLSGREIELLTRAGMVITLETGLRFLTDFLAGDVYFKTSRPRHNLDRARSQFRLLESMEKHRREMDEIITRRSRGTFPGGVRR